MYMINKDLVVDKLKHAMAFFKIKADQFKLKCFIKYIIRSTIFLVLPNSERIKPRVHSQLKSDNG